MRTLKINKTMRTLNANCTGQAVSTRWSRVLRAVSWDLGPWSLVLGPWSRQDVPTLQGNGRGEWAVIMRTL